MNLKRTLDWLSGFSNIEIIIVEQDSKPKLQAYSLKGFKHIFTISELPFNIGWAYNVGFKNSTSGVIVFGDSQTRVDPNNLIDSLRKLEQYESIIVCKNLITLNNHEFDMSFQQLQMITRDNTKQELTSGITCFRRDVIERIAGWSEDFIGQTGSYQIQDRKVKEMTNSFEMDFTGFQFPQSSLRENQIFESRNKLMLDQFDKMDKTTFERTISMSKPKIGMKMRFADK